MKTLRLLKGRLLKGYNVHHSSSVFVQPIDLDGLADRPVDQIQPGLAQRLARRFLHLTHRSTKERHDEAPAQEAVPLCEALLSAILAVEGFVACAMHRLERPSFAVARPSETQPGVTELIWESTSPSVARAAARVAMIGLAELLGDQARVEVATKRDFQSLLERIRRRAIRRQWSPGTAVLATGARLRGIPFEALAGNYLRVGDGTQQQLISESTTTSLLRRESEPRTGTAGGDQEGLPHRVLLIGSRVVSAVRLEAPVLVGDGKRTIRDWIAWLNHDPLRDGVAWRPIPLDRQLSAWLKRQGRSLDEILAPGDRLTLEDARTFERGAVPVDVTARINSEFVSAAQRHVGESGRIASTEFWVNGTPPESLAREGRLRLASRFPDLLLHATANVTRSESIGSATLDLILPPSAQARVPTALILGDWRTRSLARDLDRFLRTSRSSVGLALGGEMAIGGCPLGRSASGRGAGPDFLLRDPRVGQLVHAVSPRRIVARGLRIDRSTVCAVLPPKPDGNREVYRLGLRVGLSATSGSVVIGADDPNLGWVGRYVEPQRIVVAVADGGGGAASQHLDAGRSVVTPVSTEGTTWIEQRPDTSEKTRLPLSSILLPGKQPTERRLDRALFTAALALGLGYQHQPDPDVE